MKEAYLFEKLDDGLVKCLACAHKCVIPINGKGKCLIRSNKEGVLFLDAYGSAASVGVDKIEKKPLYHFLPGSLTFSFGTLGCNFKCGFCQNFEISMPKSFIFKKNLSPEEAVSLALKNNCESISYTYNEPAVFAEYVLDTARLAKKKGLKNVLVTNGFFSQESLNAFCELVDAVNIDLKSFNDEFYKKNCKASLKPVLDSIKFFHNKGIWVEVTTLLIPDMNDSVDELNKMAGFISSVDVNIPWHISRFFPMHKFSNRTLTSLSSIDEAVRIGKSKGLNFVYKGNVCEDAVTVCFNCGKELIIRSDLGIIINFDKGECDCGKIIRGVF